MSTHPNRREVLRSAAFGAAALATGALARAADAPRPPLSQGERLRMTIIGTGSRGTGLLKVILQHPDVEIPALCDIDEQHLKTAQDLVQKARGKRPEGYSRGPEDWRRMVARDDFQAVLLGTPQELHAVMACESMKAGKFVGSEVPAACTVEECWDIVRTQRKTGAGYMMLENYLYSSFNMQIWNMADLGLFGELTYGSGAYIHEIRSMRFNKDGSLTWRGENVANNTAIIYPTHAVGPVCRWMKVNAANGDRLLSLTCMASKAASNHEYAVKKFGPDSPAARVQWKNGDMNRALVRTENERLIEVIYDTASPRPPGMGQYSLQGTRGACEGALGQHMVYLEGRSPHEKWEPLEKYEPQYQHPLWKQFGDEAKASGHGGGDYFVIREFLNSVRTGQSAVNVVDAATWSVIRPLSEQSLAAGGKPVDFPDFRQN